MNPSEHRNTYMFREPTSAGMDYSTFQMEEIDRFTRDECTVDNALLVLADMQRKHFQKVQQGTKQGIIRGVEEFLKGRDAPVLYLLGGELSDFFDDRTTQRTIGEVLRQLRLPLGDIDPFAEDMSVAYANFIV